MKNEVIIEMPQDLNNRAVQANADSNEMERLISDFKPFLHGCAAKYSSNHSGFEQDDLFSIAMMAFYEAIKSYDDGKGHFFPFAKNVVRCNLLDHIRKVYRREHKEDLQLDDEREDGSSSAINKMSIREHEDTRHRDSIVDEIEQFKTELAQWSITMESLAAQSPKHKQLIETYAILISQVLEAPHVIQTMQIKRYFPVKEISKISGLPLKKVERARTFIIASIIIKTGDYDYLSDYVRIGA